MHFCFSSIADWLLLIFARKVILTKQFASQADAEWGDDGERMVQGGAL